MSEPRRIGVFGGTFDPLHNTHIAIARTAREHACLDEVLFVVSGQPPHKDGGPHASAEDRFEMVAAAVADEPGFSASRIEVERRGTSYTKDTLRELAERHPGAQLFLILGLDSLRDLPNWRGPDEILARAHLLAVPRGDEPDRVPPQLEGHYDALSFRESNLSSTEVRKRVHAGDPFEHLVPEPVARIIRKRGCYEAASPPSHAPNSARPCGDRKQ